MGILFPVYAGFFVQFNSPNARIVFTAGCLIAGIMVGTCAFLINRGTVMKLIGRVVRDVESLSGGDADLTRRIPVESQDKLGELPIQFNQFIEEIRAMVEITQGSMKKMKEPGKGLIGNMKETRQAVQGIEDVISEVAKRLQSQKEHIRDNREAGELLNHTVLAAITHVLELFYQMDQMTSQLLEQSGAMDNIQQGIAALAVSFKGDSTGKTNHLQGMSRLFMEQMDRMLNQDKDSYDHLMDFIRRIEDISHRTGVLAINASIEAAHSGKEGEGFKVIAQGIRILANEAESLSTQIGRTLRHSVHEVQTSHQELETARSSYKDLFVNVQEHLDAVQEETFAIKDQTENLQENYDLVKNMLQLIRDSLGGLESSTQRSLGIMKTLEQSSCDIGEYMGNIDKKIEGISVIAQKTSSQVELISRSIQDVDEKIMLFKTHEAQA